MPEKDRQPQTAVESHIAAPLTDVKRVKRVSQVSIPSEKRVEDAKKYVDSNQK